MAERRGDISFCRANGGWSTQAPREISLGLLHGPLTYGQRNSARDHGNHSLVIASTANLLVSDASAPISPSPVEQWSQSPWAAKKFDDTFEDKPWSNNAGHNVMVSKSDNGYASTDYTEPLTDCHTANGIQLPGLETLSPTVRHASNNVSSVQAYSNNYGLGMFCSKTMNHLSELGLETPATPYQATQKGSVTLDPYSQHSLQISPYTSHDGGQSYSDHHFALWRTQRSSYLMDTVVNTPGFISHGLSSDTVSNKSTKLLDTSVQRHPPRPAEFACCDRIHDLQTTVNEPIGNVGHESKPTSPSPSPFLDSSTAIAIDSDNVHQQIEDFLASDSFASLSGPPLVSSQLTATHPTTLIPHPQSPRFPGDLYSPSYTRKFGNQREGWCGLCRPGRWLALKNSAFWYDKSFTHGISAASGKVFDGPSEIRKGRKAGVLEGLCGTCGGWIALVVSKKGGLSWFRHAYKCHEHIKISKASQKRRHSGSPRNANIVKPAAADGKDVAIKVGRVVH
ncbi:hypothetical protein N7G274_004111 [Stereocaulon virgatum]|uniref:Transcription regulator Rua1 C-terminal domain-containing protein n=1 Tax=Stereocaulon virgatum TaxID=373712 RepID=A0ABR4AEP6_9LECA